MGFLDGLLSGLMDSDEEDEKTDNSFRSLAGTMAGELIRGFGESVINNLLNDDNEEDDYLLKEVQNAIENFRKYDSAYSVAFKVKGDKLILVAYNSKNEKVNKKNFENCTFTDEFIKEFDEKCYTISELLDDDVVVAPNKIIGLPTSIDSLSSEQKEKVNVFVEKVLSFGDIDKVKNFQNLYFNTTGLEFMSQLLPNINNFSNLNDYKDELKTVMKMKNNNQESVKPSENVDSDNITLQLQKLKNLFEEKLIDEEEYKAKKAKLLGL